VSVSETKFGYDSLIHVIPEVQITVTVLY